MKFTKWCIQGSKEFGEWHDKEIYDTTNVSGDTQQYYWNDNIKDNRLWECDHLIPEGYIEITFQQFLDMQKEKLYYEIY